MHLFTQLNFGGNCAEAFRYYEKHLGGRIEMLMTQREMPNAPPNATDAVIHARLAIAGTTLLGNDVPAEHFKPIRSSYIYLSVDSTEEAERVHAVLANGGQVTMPLAETFFATRFSQVRDRFGVLWSIIHQATRGA
jgi:PhnB protein